MNVIATDKEVFRVYVLPQTNSPLQTLHPEEGSYLLMCDNLADGSSADE